MYQADFTAKLTKRRALVYAMWIGQSNGQRAYCIVNIEKTKHVLFQQALKSDDCFDLSAYGELLYVEWEKPSESFQYAMNRRFGIYEDAQPKDIELTNAKSHLLGEESLRLRLISGIEAGRRYWFVLKVNFGLCEKYEASLEDLKIKISDYGDILYGGLGYLPNSNMRGSIAVLRDL